MKTESLIILRRKVSLVVVVTGLLGAFASLTFLGPRHPLFGMAACIAALATIWCNWGLHVDGD